MFLEIDCPHCGTEVSRDRAAHGKAHCPNCRRVVAMPPEEIGPGTMIAGYQVEDILGLGGMGFVFMANQLAMDRKVALKVLLPEMTYDKQSVQQFIREARMTARLDHPNIITAFDAGSDNDFHFLAMAYVDGIDLGSVIGKGERLDEISTLRMIAAVGHALEYAWEQHHLIHRDIKPGNVMVDEHGAIKLMDMGISKRFSTSPSDFDTSKSFIGTPFYMSPEQAKPQATVDFRSDMYSLGATAYHCLAGRPPFSGRNAITIMAKHARKALPSLSKYAPKVSYATCRLLEKMLAKSPNDRYQSWHALLREVDKLIEALAADTAESGDQDTSSIDTSTLRTKRLTMTEIRTRVLIIDDEPAMLKLIKAPLPASYIVKTAETATDGMAILKSFNPDIILLDLHLPGMTGLEFLQRVKSDSRHFFVRVIVISGDNTPKQRIKVYESGGDDFIAKPFSLEELNLKVQSWARFTRFQELSEMKDEFLDLMADDEVSPFPYMANAIGATRGIPALIENPEIAQFITAMETYGEDFLKRYHLMVDYVQCRYETYEIELKSFSIKSLLERYMNKWANQCEERGLVLEAPSRPPDLQVRADANSLGRVLRWLVTNAVTYAKHTVSIDYGTLGDSVQIDIGDDGNGFAPDVLPIVFDGFRPGNGLHVKRGIGLHLSLARELLGLQNAEIEISDPGPTTTNVRISLKSSS